MLSLGVSLEDAAAGPLARCGSFSDGRDIGVVFNLPGRGGVSVLPACGGVGAQYTPAAGWAQAIRYRHETLKDESYARSIAVVLAGTPRATNGFWSALNIATTLKLPMLFYIEDNAFGISVPAHLQTPGGNIAANLAAFSGLTILEGDGSDPRQAAELTQRAVAAVRATRAPLLLRLTVPSDIQPDTQAYKSPETLGGARARSTHAPAYLPVPSACPEHLAGTAARGARAGRGRRRARARASAAAAEELTRHVFSEPGACRAGAARKGAPAPGSSGTAPEGTRINMLTAIRRSSRQNLA
jgi:2-oxoisovalerate dehydrogenase E1 component